MTSLSVTVVGNVLGIGTGLPGPTAVHAANAPTVTSIDAGTNGVDSFSMAVTSDGKTWFWGAQPNRANNPTANPTEGTSVASVNTQKPVVLPIPVAAKQASTAPPASWQTLSGNNEQVAILATDGTVWTWDRDTTHEAVQLAGLSNVTQISGNPFTGYAVKSDGTLWAWGCVDWFLQYAQTCSTVPVQPPTQYSWNGLGTVTQVTAGDGGTAFGLARTSDGSVWFWGDCSHQAPSGASCNNSLIKLTFLSGVNSMAAGRDFGMALLSSGSVVTWGDSTNGELGRAWVNSPNPDDGAAIPNLTGVTAIAAGSYSGYALKSDGTVWGWGQLPGNGSSNSASAPVEVTGISGASAISAGSTTTYALTATGVLGWDLNGYVGDGTNNTYYAPVPISFSDSTNQCVAPVYCTTTVNLDNVKLWLTTPVLPDPAFTASLPSDATQVAVSSTTIPFNEFSIIAVPYGKVSSSEEELPAAAAGMAATYQADLLALRKSESGTPLPAPVATLFGQQVQAIANLVQINITPQAPSPVAITEWVTEMGQRVWIFRLAQVMVNNPLFTPPASLVGVSAASDGPMNPDNPGNNSSNGSTDSSPSGGIPSPYWWNGQTCDANFYYVQSGWNSKKLAVWNNLTACGPRPYGDGSPDIKRYFTDSNGNQVGVWQYEWECVEISKRWLWLAYGIAPRGGNGSQMVSNYSSASGLTAVPDGSGVPPAVGDVLSWGASSGTGHTAVVTDSHVDPSTGNGYIMIIEQNYSTNGVAQLAVNHFSVAPRSGSSNGWLHAGAPPAGGTASGTYPRPCQYGSSTTIYHGGPYPAGYWLVGADGGVFTIGSNLGFYGSMGGKQLNAAMVGMARTVSAQGYWLVGADGGIFSFGDAHFYGSEGGQTLNACVVGMVATPDSGGYWLVAADGGIFTFGDAGFYGSMGGQHLNAPVVGMAATPDGHGYWLVGADGGVFTFGDAAFKGSATNLGSPRPFRSMTPDASGQGYWLMNTNGQIYSFGDVQYYGGTGADCNCVGTVNATPDGAGYYMVGYNGQVWAQGDAYNRGGWTADPPFVGMALSA